MSTFLRTPTPQHQCVPHVRSQHRHPVVARATVRNARQDGTQPSVSLRESKRAMYPHRVAFPNHCPAFAVLRASDAAREKGPRLPLRCGCLAGFPPWFRLRTRARRGNDGGGDSGAAQRPTRRSAVSTFLRTPTDTISNEMSLFGPDAGTNSQLSLGPRRRPTLSPSAA